jgi:hypothetical protein
MRAATQLVEDWIAEETQRPIDPSILTVVEAIRRRHGSCVAAVLFYGSCLRQSRSADAPQEAILDFYLLVDRYRDAYGRWLPALANALLPPNVFYVEVPVGNGVLRAKYAIMSLRQFRQGTSRRSFQSSLWARFAQPARLAYARDPDARAAAVEALAAAVITMVARAVPLLGRDFSAAGLWMRGFQETYKAELRPEGPDRARLIYERDAERYDRLTPWALTAGGYGWTARPDGGLQLDPDLSAAGRRRLRRLWRVRRAVGKLLNLLRLIKGIFTFDGGMDYILWKIERHSGVRATATPWQRRHPLLSSPMLAWRLYRKGAFR